MFPERQRRFRETAPWLGAFPIVVRQEAMSAGRTYRANRRRATVPLDGTANGGSRFGRMGKDQFGGNGVTQKKPGPRCQLWVDAVGGFLVCLGDEVVIGGIVLARRICSGRAGDQPQANTGHSDS